MNEIARFYAHIYYAVPKTTQSWLNPERVADPDYRPRPVLVAAALVATVALAVLYPLGTLLAVGTFLVGGVASYSWANRQIQKHDDTPLNLDKVDLAFQVALFSKEQKESRLRFLSFLDPKTEPAWKADVLDFIKNNIPAHKADTLYRLVEELGIKQVDGSLLWDVLKTIVENGYSQDLVTESARLIKEFVLSLSIHKAMEILAKQKDYREFFVDQMLEFKPFIDNTPNLNQSDKEHVIITLMEYWFSIDERLRPIHRESVKKLEPKNLSTLEKLYSNLNLKWARAI